MHKHKWTSEDRQWMIQANTKYETYRDIVEAYNSRHEDKITLYAVQTYFKINKILRPCNVGKFTSERKPRELPIGTIRKSQTGTYIKVNNIVKRGSGYKKPDWIPLQEKIWLDAGRTIEEGKMIMFLDGNTNNFNLENLYPINRKTSVMMAKNRWYQEKAEATLCGIKYCELFQTIRGAKNDT